MVKPPKVFDPLCPVCNHPVINHGYSFASASRGGLPKEYVEMLKDASAEMFYCPDCFGKKRDFYYFLIFPDKTVWKFTGWNWELMKGQKLRYNTDIMY